MIQDRVLVNVEPSADVNPGGTIVMPAEATNRGTVLAVGPGMTRKLGQRYGFVPTTLEPGDRVQFGDRTGEELGGAGEVYRVLRESDVHLVLDADVVVATAR